MSEEQTVSTDPKPRLWWLGTSISGRPSFIEIVKVNDEEVPEDAEAPPEFGRDDTLEIDRGVFLAQVMGGQAFMEIRLSFGPQILVPTDFDMSSKSSRTPLLINGHSLKIGPYLWLKYGSPDTQVLWEQIDETYRPITDEERAQMQRGKPIIAGADGRALNAPQGPGALGAMGQF